MLSKHPVRIIFFKNIDIKERGSNEFSSCFITEWY